MYLINYSAHQKLIDNTNMAVGSHKSYTIPWNQEIVNISSVVMVLNGYHFGGDNAYLSYTATFTGFTSA